MYESEGATRRLKTNFFAKCRNRKVPPQKNIQLFPQLLSNSSSVPRHQVIFNEATLWTPKSVLISGILKIPKIEKKGALSSTKMFLNLAFCRKNGVLLSSMIANSFVPAKNQKGYFDWRNW